MISQSYNNKPANTFQRHLLLQNTFRFAMMSLSMPAAAQAYLMDSAPYNRQAGALYRVIALRTLPANGQNGVRMHQSYRATVLRSP